MDSSQEDLQTLTKLLTGSNTKIKKFIERLVNQSLIMQMQPGHSITRPFDYDYDKNIADQLQEIEEILASLDAINKGIEKIPAAHKEIRVSLDQNKAAIEALKGLVQEVQRANKFYRSLSQTK